MPPPATRAATGRLPASRPRTVKRDELRIGWRTDFLVHEGAAQILERGDCIVVRTPGNPAYYWGNFLVLPEAPVDDALDHWLQRFAQEVATGQPLCQHVAIGVSAPYVQQQLPRWREAGFDLHVSVVMRLVPGELQRDVKPARGSVTVRPLDFAHEIDALIELECSDAHGFEIAGYRQYRQRKFTRYAELHAQGRLHWFGLWCDGVLAASCGLMREHAQPGSTARFQHVMTHPQWRRRGLCTALIEAVSAYGMDTWCCQQLVMLADPSDVAIGIYRALGYQEVDSEWALQRRAPQDRPASAP